MYDIAKFINMIILKKLHLNKVQNSPVVLRKSEQEVFLFLISVKNRCNFIQV